MITENSTLAELQADLARIPGRARLEISKLLHEAKRQWCVEITTSMYLKEGMKEVTTCYAETIAQAIDQAIVDHIAFLMLRTRDAIFSENKALDLRAVQLLKDVSR